MDIMAYVADKTAKHQDASLDDAKIKEILSDNKSYVKEVNDTSFVTAKGEYTILYSELYNSGNDIIIPDDANTTTVEDINSKIGTAVTGYSAKGATWRVFYADENETFLIALIDELYGTCSIPTDNYTGSIDVKNSLYGAKWNSMWLAKCPVSDECTTDGAKGTAYMCDPTNWTEYATGCANYAVGGPTLQLMIASYNAAYGANVELSSDDFVKNGLFYRGTGDEIWDVDFEDYCQRMCMYWGQCFFSTPIDTHSWAKNDSQSALLSVFSDYPNLGSDDVSSNAGQITPIVSIPTSKISISGDTVTVLP